MDYLIGAVIALVMFLFLRTGRDSDRKRIEDIANRAREQEQKERADAEARKNLREAAAREAADRSVADRPHTDDPRADLRDRLDR